MGDPSPRRDMTIVDTAVATAKAACRDAVSLSAVAGEIDTVPTSTVVALPHGPTLSMVDEVAVMRRLSASRMM